MAKKLEDNISTWDVFLNQTLAAILFNVNESAGYTSYYLLYTRDVVLPIDNILKPRRRYLGEDLTRLHLNNNTRPSQWFTGYSGVPNDDKQDMPTDEQWM